jgi:D-alanine--poly(phosphoribitol) ligase subunit 2
MNLDNILIELRAFIRERFKVPESDPDFTDEVHLFDYGYIDSFGAVDLTAFVEQRFAIKINQSDLVAFPMNTIQEISNFVFKRQHGEI